MINWLSIDGGTIPDDADYPVTLAEVKSWLGVDYSDKDDLLTGMLKGATLTVEQALSLHLIERVVTMEVETTCAEIVPLPYTKRTTYLSVSSLDSSDEETAITANEDYFIRSTALRLPNAGRYTISYHSNPVITEDIKEAIKMEVAERFANRGENSGELSKSAMNKIQSRVVQWL